jgi:hypothetical protein
MSDIFSGIANAPAPQIVLAGSGLPARVFGASDIVPGAWNNFTLLANGISNAPTFPSGWVQQGGSWVNTAGTQNFVVVGSDNFSSYYSLGADSNGVTYPVPTSFIGSANTQTLTVGFAGAALSTAALPSGSWFSIAGTRPGSAGLSSPLPYALAPTVASLTSTSVVLKLTGSGVFLDGDLVTLSYEPTPPGNPLQDASTGYYKVPGFVAAITVE